MYRKIHQNIIPFFVLLFVFCSCKKESQTSQPVIVTAEKKVLVVGEGSLGNGNATLGLYYPDSNLVNEDIFNAVNHQTLGDIFQSIQLIGDRYFLCINNSDKIVVINKNDFQLQGIIAVSKPRYILPVSEEKAYVSTLFSNKIEVVNLHTLAIENTITLPANNAERMLKWNDKAIVCNWDTAVNTIHYIDVETDKIVQSIAVSGKAPQECLLDKEGMLWILSGDVYRKVAAKLTRLNPATGAILKTFSFPSGTDVVKPTLNNTKDSLYFIEVQYDGSAANNGVYRMNIQAETLPATAFIAAQSFQYFWAIGMEPATGNIFIGDPKGFSQKGGVTIYQPDGKKLNEFKVGVGPNSFFFAY